MNFPVKEDETETHLCGLKGFPFPSGLCCFFFLPLMIRNRDNLGSEGCAILKIVSVKFLVEKIDD